MVDERIYGEYSDALGANAELARRACSELCARLAGLEGDALEEAAREAYRAIVATFGDAASAIAVEFYMAQREASGVPAGYTAEIIQSDGRGKVGLDVSKAVAGSDMAASLAATATQRVMEDADATILGNARRDPAHPKWAFVPHAGACGWCRMMGSRGFDYCAKGTAEAVRHPSCKCSVVVDFSADPALEGYDPDSLYGEYSDARKEIESDALAQWEAMGDMGRKEFELTHKAKGRNAYDVFLRNKTIARMNGAKGKDEAE